MKALKLALLFVLIMAPPVLSRGLDPFRTPAPPQIVSPSSDQVDLTGKDSLEFKWIIIDSARVDYCELKLYKGYETLQSTLILKQQISADTSSFQLKSSTFEDGQVYTWSLKEVSRSGQKSDRVVNSFKVIKK